jgi:hypothetical protein
MYTGTLIKDLMATVELAGKRVEQQRLEEELHEIFTMQIPIADGGEILMGAA